MGRLLQSRRGRSRACRHVGRRRLPPLRERQAARRPLVAARAVVEDRILPRREGRVYHFRFEFFEAAGEARAQLELGTRQEELLRKAAGEASAVVYCGGFNADLEGEGFDRSFELPKSRRPIWNCSPG